MNESDQSLYRNKYTVEFRDAEGNEVSTIVCYAITEQDAIRLATIFGRPPAYHSAHATVDFLSS